jgi:hypothetical protein
VIRLAVSGLFLMVTNGQDRNDRHQAQPAPTRAKNKNKIKVKIVGEP